MILLIFYFKTETKYIEIGRLTETNIDILCEKRDRSDIYSMFDLKRKKIIYFLPLFNILKIKASHIKLVKFNKRKHKKSEWITSGIIKYINQKDLMYK